MKIWVDGATERIACIMEKGLRIIQPIPESTNNEAEYKAAIFALRAAQDYLSSGQTEFAELDIYSDSELVVRQVRGEYAIKEPRLIALWNQVQGLILNFKRVDFHWVPREDNWAGRLLG